MSEQAQKALALLNTWEEEGYPEDWLNIFDAQFPVDWEKTEEADPGYQSQDVVLATGELLSFIPNRRIWQYYGIWQGHH